jgi:hypothetical protein
MSHRTSNGGPFVCANDVITNVFVGRNLAIQGLKKAVGNAKERAQPFGSQGLEKGFWINHYSLPATSDKISGIVDSIVSDSKDLRFSKIDSATLRIEGYAARSMWLA